MKTYAEKTGDFCNNKKVMEEIVAAKTNKSVTLGGQDQFQAFVKSADGVSLANLITPYDATIKTAFSEEFTNYSMKGTYKTVDEAIAGFKKNVAAKVADITVE